MSFCKDSCQDLQGPLRNCAKIDAYKSLSRWFEKSSLNSLILKGPTLNFFREPDDRSFPI